MRNHADDIPWTEEQTQYLLTNNIVLSRSQIGRDIGKSRNAVCAKAHRLGLTKLTPAESAKLKPRQPRASRSHKPAVATFLVRPLPVARAVSIDPNSPEALAAAALLAEAYEAENRREGYRLQGVR